MRLRSVATCSAIAALGLATMIGVGQQPPSLQLRPPAITSPATVSTIPAGTGLHVVLDHEISSATAKIGEPFTGHLLEALGVDGTVIAPAGTVIKGRVMDVTNAGRRFHGRNNILVRPETMMLADGRQIDISGVMIDTYDRNILKVDGEGAVRYAGGHYGRMVAIGTGVGTVAGAVIGGPVGAVAGGSIGAALPTARWATKNDPVVLPSGSSYWFELARPASLGVNRAALSETKDGGN